MADSSTEGLERILSDVGARPLDTNICKRIVKLLDSCNNVQLNSIQKLLKICIQNTNDDIEYATETLNIVSLILKKVTDGEFVSEPDLDLLPSMCEILHTLNTSVCSYSDEIKILYFKLLISYPDEVYLKLEEDDELLGMFNLYVNSQISIHVRVQPINVLHKYLKILPPDKRLQFVEKGINSWFLKLIPSVMLCATNHDVEIETYLDVLETIVNEFQYIDYSNNPNWQCVLQCLYNAEKYPAIMKNLLMKNNDIWCRLWVLFIKMLKNQLTKSGTSGSPINSMLPIVETAFKMDVTNRCRAFQCWNVLIDNFATETNGIYTNKRIKLLVIPLNSNNAKVEETVIAKINTWWHLICHYFSKLSNFAEIILIPFLQFCFGNPIVSSKPVFIPGALTDKTKEYCVEAFVNILGHHNCVGCVSLPVLRERILNDKILLVSKKHLMYSISATIKIVANTANMLRQPCRCAWISYVKTICDMSNDDLRRGLFNDLLDMLESLIQNIHDENLADIVLNDLILTLFKADDKMIQLLNPINEKDSPLIKIFSIMLDPIFDNIYSRDNMSKTGEILKPFADFIVGYCFHTSIIDAFLNRLLEDYKSLALWTAMASSICRKKCGVSSKILFKMLQWPLKYLDLFTEVEFSTSMWLSLLDFVRTKLDSSSINEKIFEVLKNFENSSVANPAFFLKASIVLLSQKITADKGYEYEKEVRLVYDISNKFLGLNHTHAVFPKLIDVLLELFKKLIKNVNLSIAKLVLMILKLVFRLLLSEFKKSTEIDAALLIKVKEVLNLVENLLKLETYAPLKEIVLTEFLEYAQYFGQQEALKVTILAILQMFLKGMDNNNTSVDTIKSVIASLNENSNSIILSETQKFTTPATKKSKKKETSIVNTVVEGGEEFVVVKSNWKFNPKKLTDNQKEKLKRKREDIPALYQDLSQSQDEFKLGTWKTDSQDTTTTTTSSKSNELTTSEKVSTILKNMPNTDVVPKILKNILTESNETVNNLTCETPSKKHINDIQTPLNNKRKPRLSLKDRVFRNVRILVEKSDIQNDKKTVKSLSDDITPQLQTPTRLEIKMSGSNSAPSEINVERPSRVKRKPKKFEEMELFARKKSRQFICDSESKNKESFEGLNQSQEVTEKSEIEETNLNSSDVVNQEEPIPPTNSSESLLKRNDAQCKNIFNIDYEILPQDENVDKQQQINESNVGETSITDVENNIAVDNLIVSATDKIQTDIDQVEMKNDSSSQIPLKKKTGKKKSRIEKELAIDMVEGHPFLKVQSEKRLTRNKASESPVNSKRKSLTRKINRAKTDQNNMSKVDKKIKEIDKVLDKSIEVDTFVESEKSSGADENGSQDIIESSQDSTLSIMSVKSTKIVKRIPVVTLENIEHTMLSDKTNQSNMNSSSGSKTFNDSEILSCKQNDDSEFPVNKTGIEYAEIDLTENLDTESIGNISSNEVIEIKDENEPRTAVNLDGTYIDMDTQDIADADTQSVESKTIVNATLELESNTSADETKCLDEYKLPENANLLDSASNIDISSMDAQDESTRSMTESLLCTTETKHDESSSKIPTTDEDQRKQDFLNNTLEISPIKTLSPVRDNKSPSPETSSDYVVIKLSSPVQSNGQPFTKCASPEIFTEEKVSPDKRDQSPPRDEARVITVSPRSLSLKRNKPQVRSGGRAAQMLGLCIPAPDILQNTVNSEKPVEPEESKKSSPLNSSARRNLRILYNSTHESSEASDENDETKKFLEMKRSLPATDSSPSVPILKRKLADVADDTTITPANKRKRVSFHDPPVSTTVCVKKYIDPVSVRSPQNSAIKRQERQSRYQVCVNLKSQKRLDTVFKLDTALTKAVESFSESDVIPTADTEMSSLEPTPLVEIVKNSELNDVDPICLDLINCKDPVDNIAGDLSSSAMRPLLVKEFAGKIETVGDLAKMSELEVNRLCIKAPKVQVAKKVLTEYAKKISIAANEMTPTTEAAFSESTVLEPKAVHVEIQTDCIDIESVEMQTDTLATSLACTQTDTVSTVDCYIQTDESGSKSTADIARSLLEKPDYCEHLNNLLDVHSKQTIATSLPLNVLTDTVLREVGSNNSNNHLKLSFMRDYLRKHFSSKDLILLCSDLLKAYANNI